jgi:hypothetical protein
MSPVAYAPQALRTVGEDCVVVMNSHLSVDHQDLDEMTCQLCLARAATHRVTDRSSASRSEQRYYCSQCYYPGGASAVDPCPEALDGSRDEEPFPARVEGGVGTGAGIEGRAARMVRLHHPDARIRRLAGLALGNKSLVQVRLFRTVRKRRPTLAYGRASDVHTCSISQDTGSVSCSTAQRFSPITLTNWY